VCYYQLLGNNTVLGIHTIRESERERLGTYYVLLRKRVSDYRVAKTVCCSAVCGSVLQCVVVCCNMCVAVENKRLQGGDDSMLQCVVVCCSVW